MTETTDIPRGKAVSHGWTWIMRDIKPPVTKATKFRNVFDGAYTAACPGCGHDVYWNAFNGQPLCDCAGPA